MSNPSFSGKGLIVRTGRKKLRSPDGYPALGARVFRCATRASISASL
jgi:hypothetical protein